VRRRPEQEREETDAREQAEARRLALIDELKARELAARLPAAPPPPEATAEVAPEPAPDDEAPAEPE
jgi:hypothetical protein